MNKKSNLNLTMPNIPVILEDLYKRGELSEKEYLLEMLAHFEDIYSEHPDVLEQVRHNYDTKLAKYNKKTKKRAILKKLTFNSSLDVFILIIHLICTYFLGEIISSFPIDWYIKYLLIGYILIVALYILSKMKNNNCHIVEIHKFDLPYSRYKSNIEYIKNREGYLEEDIILKAVNRYGEQLELKEEADITFNNFEALYKHFKTISTEDKWELLCALPSEYHTLILKKLIKED